MNFFDHKDLGYHLLQLYPKVVKHPVYKIYCYFWIAFLLFCGVNDVSVSVIFNLFLCIDVSMRTCQIFFN